MLDITLRPLKDRLFDPLTGLIPRFITPLHITFAAFVCGTLACYYATCNNTVVSLLLWAANRALDCLDGALARRRGQASDLGGFLDLLGDFIVYSTIPIACALADETPRLNPSDIVPSAARSSLWLPVAALEAMFHINNFVLFFIAALLEKRKAMQQEEKAKDLTSVAMRPALVEGLESGVFFTAMLAWPHYVRELSWFMALAVCFGSMQRIVWLVSALH